MKPKMTTYELRESMIAGDVYCGCGPGFIGLDAAGNVIGFAYQDWDKALEVPYSEPAIVNRLKAASHRVYLCMISSWMATVGSSSLAKYFPAA